MEVKLKKPPLEVFMNTLCYIATTLVDMVLWINHENTRNIYYVCVIGLVFVFKMRLNRFIQDLYYFDRDTFDMILLLVCNF